MQTGNTYFKTYTATSPETNVNIFSSNIYKNAKYSANIIILKVLDKVFLYYTVHITFFVFYIHFYANYISSFIQENIKFAKTSTNSYMYF